MEFTPRRISLFRRFRRTSEQLTPHNTKPDCRLDSTHGVHLETSTKTHVHLFIKLPLTLCFAITIFALLCTLCMHRVHRAHTVHRQDLTHFKLKFKHFYFTGLQAASHKVQRSSTRLATRGEPRATRSSMEAVLGALYVRSRDFAHARTQMAGKVMILLLVKIVCLKISTRNAVDGRPG